MKLVKIVLVVLAVWLALGLLFESAIGHYQPQGGYRGVELRTFDADGTAHDRMLWAHVDKGEIWVESGHWFRGWYNRLLENPQVELVRDGEAVGPFTAIPVDDPQVVQMLTSKMGKGQEGRTRAYWIARTLSMFAPIKPVRLDPEDGASAAAEIAIGWLTPPSPEAAAAVAG